MNKLKEMMDRKGLNNPALAKLVGCKPVEIWRLSSYPGRKDTRKLTVDWAQRLAPYLDVSPQELLFDNDKKPMLPWENNNEIDPEEYFRGSQLYHHMDNRIDELESEVLRLKQFIKDFL